MSSHRRRTAQRPVRKDKTRKSEESAASPRQYASSAFHISNTGFLISSRSGKPYSYRRWSCKISKSIQKHIGTVTKFNGVLRGYAGRSVSVLSHLKKAFNLIETETVIGTLQNLDIRQFLGKDWSPTEIQGSDHEKHFCFCCSMRSQ